MGRYSITVLLLAGLVAGGGCASLHRVMYTPGKVIREVPVVDASPQVMFVAFQQVERGKQAQKPESRDQKPKGEDEEAAAKKTDKPAAAPGRAQAAGYTAPSAAYRQVAMVTTAATAAGGSDMDGAGRELSELSAMSIVPTGTTGLAGLTAPPSVGQGAVLSLPGLQQGPAAGLGFAGTFNILTPQTNPLSGTLGRCNDLAAAGFFERDPAACVRQFTSP